MLGRTHQIICVKQKLVLLIKLRHILEKQAHPSWIIYTCTCHQLMIIHGALVTHVHNAKMRSSLTCHFHICEVPTYEEKKKKRNATISCNCNFAKLNSGLNTSLTIRPNLLFESSLMGIFCWNPQSQSSAIQINTVADPDRKTFSPIFSRWQWWMAVCLYLFGFPGNGVLLSLVITWSALAYRWTQQSCTVPDRYSGGLTHCLDVMIARKNYILLCCDYLS